MGDNLRKIIENRLYDDDVERETELENVSKLAKRYFISPPKQINYKDINDGKEQ